MITKQKRLIFIHSLKLIYGAFLLLLIPSDVLMLLTLIILSTKLLTRHPFYTPPKTLPYRYEFYSTGRASSVL